MEFHCTLCNACCDVVRYFLATCFATNCETSQSQSQWNKIRISAHSTTSIRALVCCWFFQALRVVQNVDQSTCDFYCNCPITVDLPVARSAMAGNSEYAVSGSPEMITLMNHLTWTTSFSTHTHTVNNCFAVSLQICRGILESQGVREVCATHTA